MGRKSISTELSHNNWRVSARVAARMQILSDDDIQDIDPSEDGESSPRLKTSLEREKKNGFWTETLYNLETLWLFTASDFKSMIYPNIVCSVTCCASNSSLGLSNSDSFAAVVYRLRTF